MKRTPPARPLPWRLPATALALVLLTGIWTPQSRAQTTDDRASAPNATSASESEWGLGVGAGVRRKPYRGIGNTYSVVPVPWYENRWVHFYGLGADLKLPPVGPVSFRLRARYALSDGYEASDSPYLAGMEERKAKVWFGGAALWPNSVANVSVEWMGSSEGQIVGIGLNRDFQFGRLRVTPRVSAQWVSNRYADYYYGVRASELRADRPYYEGESTVNLEAGLRFDYRLTRHQGLYLDVTGTRFGSGISDSPIVGRSHGTAVRVGYLYRF